MGAIIVILFYGELGAISGGTINAIRRMIYSEEGFLNTLSEGFFGYFWGSFFGFFISEVLFFSILFL